MESEEQCELSVREKMYVLLHRVRASGLFNMYTETGAAVVHAQCLGHYIGLLHFPHDYVDGTMMQLDAIYMEYLRMPANEASRYMVLADRMTQPNDVIKQAVFVMRWIGKEMLRRMRRLAGSVRAESLRDMDTRLIPMIGTAETDRGLGQRQAENDQHDLAFGIARYTSFIGQPENVRTLTNAADREFKLVQCQ